MTKKSIYIIIALSVAYCLFTAGLVQANSLTPEPTDLPDISFNEFIVNIINFLAGLISIVCVLVIVIAGFLWATSGGDDERAGNARKWIVSAIGGLIVVLAAWAIVNVIVENLTA